PPWVTAFACSGFSSSRMRWAAGSGGSEQTEGRDESARDTADLTAAQRGEQPKATRVAGADRRVWRPGRTRPTACSAPVDRREPAPVRRFPPPDQGEVAHLDRPRHRTWMDAAPQGESVDGDHGCDLPAAAAEKRLVGQVELGAIDVALDRRLAELGPEQLQEGRP